MSRIYIAGPMTGIPEYNRPAFFEAAAQLMERGHTVLNPATLPNGLTQPQYMDICCAMLRCAESIFLLDGWEQSAGARAERALAEKLELDVIFQIDWQALSRMENATDMLIVAAPYAFERMRAHGEEIQGKKKKDAPPICNQQISGL